MERCPKCGNKVSHIDVLCPRCGALVEVIQVRKNFLPSAAGDNVSAHRSERPNLIVYNEDFPAEGLFSNTEPSDDEPKITPSMSDASVNSFSELSNVPDFDLPELPVFEDTALESPVEEEFLAEEDTLVEKEALAEHELLPESRMARRTRQRQWLELEEMRTGKASPESELLAEADKLTSDLENDHARTDDDVAMGSDAIYQDSGPRRYRARQHEKVKTTKKSNPRKLSAPVVIVLWAMIAAVIFLGFFYLNRYVQSNHGSYAAFVRQITNGKIELDTNSAYSDTVSVSAIGSKTAAGDPAHTFTVNAPGAASLRVLPTGDVFDVQDGMAAFTLSDEDMARALGVVTYDASFVTDGLSIDLSYSSSTRSYTIEPLELFLLHSEYMREAPLVTQSITDDTVAISLIVAPGATVFINNENHSGKVGDDGLVSVILPLDSGDNYFTVEVIQPGRQAVKDSFIVNRQLAKTLLEPEWEYQRVYSDSFECRGKTEPGATLSAELDGQSFAGLVSENGVFSVACRAESYGLHMITLKATSDNVEETELTVAVERLPEQSAFMKNAREMKASVIIKDAGKLSGVGIKLVDQVQNLTAEKHVARFSVTAGSSSLSCYYHGANQLTEKSSYTFFGMIDEKTNEFYIMFVE